MDALIVYPENKEQLAAVKAVMKAMKITFEQTEKTYPAQVVEGVKQSLRQANEGKLTAFTSVQDILTRS
ncbi:hypothetical protein INP83_07705 [Mucilaginibacter sp. 21P]|uniref:DUF2683 family protein n=1 Tax=Mucilaginibacter sp. 21P TaxID=2778902 RepID=UPI001C56EF31|nr:DUF2683 family protein [Mucilaginibacter sp. 21P]QXV66956.1 hypothetical protein INP83_07705 [Mucilaginibacter sp. 21P]